ncbi:diiron oxygenase [Chitinivorax sp. B]|uniref:diiron oxygenase n=1 Tax=Chitinivorax sp. B TaxID=2502235 RepID=UPI0010F62466|nr:diiron oxygenase [Chitinivorax sp. B]
MNQMLNDQIVSPSPTMTSDGLATHRMLERISSSWGRRAQVRRGEAHESHTFDLTRPDFLVELLPFQYHPRFKQLNESELGQILTSAWLIYNAKTLDIENYVVSPLCVDAMTGHYPGIRDQLSQQLICETMVDESYHVLLTINACTVTRRMRDTKITIPCSTLVQRMQAFAAQYSEPWQKRLVHFATCVVSEIFISDHLLLISSSDVVQPLHQQVVDAHRRDEATHRMIFREFAQKVYRELSPSQQQFFATILPKPVRWFAAQDFACWHSILSELGIPDITDMIHDCQTYHATRVDVDYSGVIDLARELGITDTLSGREAFGNEGLLD